MNHYSLSFLIIIQSNRDYEIYARQENHTDQNDSSQYFELRKCKVFLQHYFVWSKTS